MEHINENRNEIRTHHLFHKPAYFKLRVGLLLILVALSLSSAATMILYFPVYVGRLILETLVGHDRKIHEMYTVRSKPHKKYFLNFFCLNFFLQISFEISFFNEIYTVRSKPPNKYFRKIAGTNCFGKKIQNKFETKKIDVCQKNLFDKKNTV